jgi:integrase
MNQKEESPCLKLSASMKPRDLQFDLRKNPDSLKAHFSISADGNAEGLVFSTRDGGPLASNNLRNRGLRSACKRAGLPKLSWHALRDTHGTLLHVQGTPLKVVQAQLGHSDLATTLEVYTHASVIAQREAVNLLESQVFPKRLSKAPVQKRWHRQLIDSSR